MPAKLPSRKHIASAQQWLKPRPGVAAGKLDLHRLHSSALANERSICVVPPRSGSG